MDLAQSCIENAERNLSSTFDKLSKRKNASPSRRGSPDAGESCCVLFDCSCRLLDCFCRMRELGFFGQQVMSMIISGTGVSSKDDQ